jgi:trehalose-phosphatase
MSRPKRMAPSLAANWNRAVTQIQASPRVVIFLDFDGTLVDLAPLPNLVRLTAAARRALRRLARHPRVTIVVISGRRRFELQRYVSLPGIRYFGLYGWERTGRPRLPRAAVTTLRAARSRSANHLGSIPGLWIEDKDFSFSVHLLDVPPAAQRRARRQLRSLLLPFQKELCLIENLRDAEVVPRCIQSKGSIVKEILAQKGRSAFPVYFGDDLSDEPAFEAVGRGLSIRVGAPRPTRARYSIRSPAELAAILAKLEAILG